MAKDIIARYIWIIDTLTKYGRLTREELDELWLKSSITDGKRIPRRTFFYYRRGIEENFHIEISCNSRGEYFIEKSDDESVSAYTNLLLDSFAVNNMLRENQNVSQLIQVESIPSARDYLSQVTGAVRNHNKIEFSYEGFNRSRIEKGIMFHPSMLKLYKQRWYMIGEKPGEKGLRTYALDRVKSLKTLNDTFEPMEPEVINEEFKNILGITSSKAAIKVIKLKADRTQAKYLRALPMHQSQQEEIHDEYSIFTFKLKLNYELVHEILGMGSSVVVLEPQELKAMIINELESNLKRYGGD